MFKFQTPRAKREKSVPLTGHSPRLDSASNRILRRPGSVDGVGQLPVLQARDRIFSWLASHFKFLHTQTGTTASVWNNNPSQVINANQDFFR
jgi:hypothetical protein